MPNDWGASMANNGQGTRRRLADYLEYLADIGVETLPKAKGTRIKADTTSAGTRRENTAAESFLEAVTILPADASPGLLTVKDSDLAGIRADMGECRRCKLAKNRIQIVFGSGSPQAKVMFIGEGPGADEDQQGVPFVGKAGQLLTKIIEAIRFTREEVYIANVVKCRPPGNRTPEGDEIAACRDFLFRQIAVIKPWIICALGAPSAQTLLGVKTPIGQIRGKWFPCRGTWLIPTFHPSYLLRNPSAKKEVWEDVKSLRARYDALCREAGR